MNKTQIQTNLGRFIMVLICLFTSLPFYAQSPVSAGNPVELYVRLKPDFPLSNSVKPATEVIRFFNEVLGEGSVQSVRASFWFSKNEVLRSTYRIKLESTVDPTSAISKLSSSADVLLAERVPVNSRFYTPDDLGSNSQGAGGQWYLYKIRSQQAWDLQRGVATVKVAVVDDAVDVDHTDLVGAMLPGYDVAMDDEDPRPPGSDHSHGTHVSGLIAANTNNGFGMASLAHGVKIYPIKASTDDNPNEVSNGLEGIEWATTAGAQVINLSWGSEVSSQTGLMVVGNAYNAGIVVIASAGNTGNTEVSYPAGYPHVISVAALNNLDAKANFSTFGKWIDISAPGVQIWSLAPEDTFSLKDGTSFAAPLVSGLAALLLSKNSLLTVDQVESCIESSADNIDLFNNSYAGLLGAGRINAEQALTCVISENAGKDIALVDVLSPETSQCQSSFNPVIRVRNDGSDTLHAFTVRYQLDSEFPLEMTWVGILDPGATEVVSIPQMNAAPGTHLLRISINSSLDGSFTDAYLPNNAKLLQFQVFSTVGQSLPFNETFETASFATNRWTVANPSTDFTWEIVTSEGTTPGSRSARLPYFIDYGTGSRDYLVSPALNFTGYSAITLTFKHAYQARVPNLSDSLIVSVSTDCGQNWIRLKAMGEGVTRTFATGPISGQFFLPDQINDWCGQPTYAACSSISLTPYVGLTGVRLRFEGYNASGNNIYLDNINVTGTVVNRVPEANFSVTGNSSVCVDEPVTFTNMSLYQPVTYQWLFPGAEPDSSVASNPLVTYSTPGTYSASLMVINPTGRDTLVKTDYIVVLPKPDIIITANPDTICRGSSSELTASGGISYLWNSGAGLASQLNDSVNVAPQNSATYSLTGIDVNGCSNQASFPVGVVGLPVQPAISQPDAQTLTTISAVSYEWFRNGVVIEGENSQTLPITLNGNYNVRIYDQYGCSAVSVPFTVTSSTVGIQDLNVGGSLIYPNPADQFIRISNQKEVAQVAFFSMDGKLIEAFQTHPTENQLTIPVNSFVNGIYLVKVSGNSGTVVHRVVVMH